MLAAFLITPQYCLAMGAGVLESVLRGYILQRSPFITPISLLGAGLVVIGEVIRKTAMVRCHHVCISEAPGPWTA